MCSPHDMRELWGAERSFVLIRTRREVVSYSHDLRFPRHTGRQHLYRGPSIEKDVPLFEKKETYSPAEAKRAYDRLDQLVAEKTITARQAGAHRRHIASRVRVTLKPVYNAQAAKRAKTEIAKLTEAGTITLKSAAAYRAHITKRTFAV